MSDDGRSAIATGQAVRLASALVVLRMLRLPIAILVVLLGFALFEPRIVSTGNLRNVLIQSSYLAVFAMAQTVVILTRGFDLSLGVTVSLVSVTVAMVMVHYGGTATAVFIGLGAALAVAAVVGLANGLLVGGIGINPLVTTLGMSYIVVAFATTISGGFPVSGLPREFTWTLARGTVLGVPVPVFIAAAMFAVLFFMLRATRFGRSLFIIGANPRAADASGIRRTPVLILAYTVCSLVTAVGALMLTARTGSGEPTLGGNLTLEAIAAAVVGGVRLAGGEGGVAAAVMGAVLITVLSNGMNLVQTDGYIQQIVLGAIIIGSLIVNRDEFRR